MKGTFFTALGYQYITATKKKGSFIPSALGEFHEKNVKEMNSPYSKFHRLPPHGKSDTTWWRQVTIVEILNVTNSENTDTSQESAN